MTIRLRASAVASLTATGDWADIPTHMSVWIDTDLLDTGALSQALGETPEDNEVLRIPDEGIPLNITLTGAGEAALNRIVSAGLDEVTCKVGLHTGNPGSSGTANELTAARNPGYARITVPLESLVV